MQFTAAVEMQNEMMLQACGTLLTPNRIAEEMEIAAGGGSIVMTRRQRDAFGIRITAQHFMSHRVISCNMNAEAKRIASLRIIDCCSKLRACSLAWNSLEN